MNSPKCTSGSLAQSTVLTPIMYSQTMGTLYSTALSAAMKCPMCLSESTLANGTQQKTIFFTLEIFAVCISDMKKKNNLIGAAKT